MRNIAVLLGASVLVLTGAALAQGGLPEWAYPLPASIPAPSKPDDTVQHRVPNSKAGFTEAGVNDRFNVPDWHPQGHPAMPRIVEHGKAPDVMACGYCHLPNGHGRPENASLAGQPANYLAEQVKDMREGRRVSSGKMGSTNSMLKIAKAVSPEDVRTAAEYFERTKYTKWIRVVETDTVPKTSVSSHNMMVRAAGGGAEKLGQRIIEMPEDVERVELRDDASGFVAYVPRGSIAKGKKLVAGGVGAQPCTDCHGKTLHGDGDVPALAGRSPSYIARQLYDFQHGTRGGPAADPMKPEVANLTDDSRIAIAAYLASLKP